MHGREPFAERHPRREGMQLEVEEVVFNGLAASLSVLAHAKELGALVIDIGSGTTDYVVYHGGVIKHTGVLAVGGDHVTNDLAFGLKVPAKAVPNNSRSRTDTRSWTMRLPGRR